MNSLCLSAFSALLLASALSSAPVAISASGIVPDLTDPCSISVTLEADTDHAPVPGGLLTCRKVAEPILADGELTYELVPDFAEAGCNLTDLSDEALPEELEAYAARWDLSGVSASPDAAGQAAFDGLTSGLYLITQTEPADGYYAIGSFLVTVPAREDGVWVCRVDASPKVQACAAIPTPSSSHTPSGNPSAIPSHTTWVGGRLPQTGQPVWPIPLLTGSGLLCIGLGRLLTRRKGRKHRRER